MTQTRRVMECAASGVSFSVFLAIINRIYDGSTLIAGTVVALWAYLFFPGGGQPALVQVRDRRVTTTAGMLLIATAPTTTMWVGSEAISWLTNAGKVVSGHVTHTPASMIPPTLGRLSALVSAIAAGAIASAYRHREAPERRLARTLISFVIVEMAAVVLAFCSYLTIPPDGGDSTPGAGLAWLAGCVALGVAVIAIGMRAVQAWADVRVTRLETRERAAPTPSVHQ